MGQGRDPWVAIPREQIALLFRLYWTADPIERADMDVAWNCAYEAVNRGELKWSSIVGPIQATMAVLHMLGWKAPRIYQWQDANGETFNITALGKQQTWRVVEAIERDAETKVWRRAAREQPGKYPALQASETPSWPRAAC